MLVPGHVSAAQLVHISAKFHIHVKVLMQHLLITAQEEDTKTKMEYVFVLKKLLSGMEIAVLLAFCPIILILQTSNVYPVLLDFFMTLVFVFQQIAQQLRPSMFYLDNVFVLGIVLFKQMVNAHLVKVIKSLVIIPGDATYAQKVLMLIKIIQVAFAILSNKDFLGFLVSASAHTILLFSQLLGNVFSVKAITMLERDNVQDVQLVLGKLSME